MAYIVNQGAAAIIPSYLRSNGGRDPLIKDGVGLVGKEIYAQFSIDGTLTAIECTVAGNPIYCDVNIPLTDLESSLCAAGTVKVDFYVANTGNIAIVDGVVDLATSDIEYTIFNGTFEVKARQA